MDAKLEQKALLPCPFCGGQPTLSLVGNVRSTRKCVIKCGGCRIQRIDAALRYGHDWLKDKAITAWNTRALQAQPAEGGVGFVLVPVEPTAEMLQAGFLCESNGFVIQRPQDAPYHVWKAMIAAFRWRSFAAPKPATTTGEGVGEGTKLWLWKHHDHFLAFTHEYPCFTPGGDPMTLGPPAGYALFHVSYDRDTPTPPADKGVGDD